MENKDLLMVSSMNESVSRIETHKKAFYGKGEEGEDRIDVC